MRALLASLTTLGVAACATAPDDVSVACARGRPGPFVGEWTLDRIEGVPWRLTNATLIVEPKGFGGGLACNGYGTSEPEDGGDHYTVANGRLMINGDLVTTSAGCVPPQLLVFEATFLAILDSEPRVSLTEDRLCFYTEQGDSLEFVPTESAS